MVVLHKMILGVEPDTLREKLQIWRLSQLFEVCFCLFQVQLLFLLVAEAMHYHEIHVALHDVHSDRVGTLKKVLLNEAKK